jgi:hypothetical protein
VRIESLDIQGFPGIHTFSFPFSSRSCLNLTLTYLPMHNLTKSIGSSTLRDVNSFIDVELRFELQKYLFNKSLVLSTKRRFKCSDFI